MRGVMQYGPPFNKKGTIKIVANTKWNGFIELNRMVFDDCLPRNSESRALSISFKLLRAHYPHIEWVVSFADAMQCGDGAIYRASGFVLTGIGKNGNLLKHPITGEVIHRMQAQHHLMLNTRGWQLVKTAQLRYVYFLNRCASDRLTVPIIPFGEIPERLSRLKLGDGLVHSHSGGAAPTEALQHHAEA